MAETREETAAEKGFFILPGQLFENVLAAESDENLNETLGHIFCRVERADSEHDFV